MSAQLETTLEALCANANANVESRLRSMHKIIQGFKKNSVELTAPNLVNALNAIGITMSKSSIYNKKVRGKDNPYRVLVDAWHEAINEMKERKAESQPNVHFTSMSNADYESIGSDVVKFKVQNMYNELRSARSQINMLKEVKGLPLIEETDEALLFHKDEKSVGLISSEQPLENPSASVEDYISTLEDFVSGSNKLGFDEDGSLFASAQIRKNDPLSDIELKEALVFAIKALRERV